jgi:hypothetical protein
MFAIEEHIHIWNIISQKYTVALTNFPFWMARTRFPRHSVSFYELLQLCYALRKFMMISRSLEFNVEIFVMFKL